MTLIRGDVDVESRNLSAEIRSDSQLGQVLTDRLAVDDCEDSTLISGHPTTIRR